MSYTWRCSDVAARLGFDRSVVARKARRGEIPGAALVLGEVRFDPAITGPWLESVVVPLVPADQRTDTADIPFGDLVRAAEERIAKPKKRR